MGLALKQYEGLTAEQRQEQYLEDRKLVRTALKTQVRFLGTNFLVRMGLTVLGGCTGRGKSTANSNVLADFWRRYPERNVIAISNEEVSADVLDRSACVLLGLDFYAYRDGHFNAEDEQRVQRKAFELMKRVEVVCTTAADMTCLDDVVKVLQYAKEKENVHLVCFDYLQTVTWSRKYPLEDRYKISKRLGLFLKEYGRSVSIPVLIFAQLYPGAEESDFGSRVQGDKTFVNHAVCTLEIVPDFEAKTTKFVVHKDRFSGQQGKVLTFDWVCGRLVEVKEF